MSANGTNGKHSNGHFKGFFISPSSGKLSVDSMIEMIVKFVEDEPDGYYRLVIGTDSQVRSYQGARRCDYVTAIVIHREGTGARYFWRKDKSGEPAYLREKIYNETSRSLETAHTLVPTLRDLMHPANYDLEIHIDVGAMGKTRDMIKEVVGMVNGNGFKAKTKPQSWGASSVADKHT